MTTSASHSKHTAWLDKQITDVEQEIAELQHELAGADDYYAHELRSDLLAARERLDGLVARKIKWLG